MRWLIHSLTFICLASFVCIRVQAMEETKTDKKETKKKGENEDSKGRQSRGKKKTKNRRRSCSRTSLEDRHKIKKEERTKKSASLSAESGSFPSITPDVSPRELPQLLRNILEGNIAAVEEHGEELRSNLCVDDQANGPFHYVRSVNMFRALMRIPGIDPELRNNQNETPFLRAVSLGLTELVQEFLQYRIDLNAQDINGNGPLHHAARSGNGDVVRLLFIGNQYGASNAHVTNNLGQLPLTIALQAGHFKEALLLLQRYYATNDFARELNTLDENGNLPIFLAIHTPCAPTQAQNRQDIVSVPVENQVQREDEPRAEERSDVRQEVIDALVHAGARLDRLNGASMSVLHGVPTAQIAEILLKHIDNMERREYPRFPAVNRQGGLGLNRPLHDALSAAIVEVLVNHRANISGLNGSDRLPIEVTKDKGVVRKLIELGAKVDLSMERIGSRQSLIAVLIEDKYKDENGNTLLHMTPSLEIAKLCIEGGLHHDVPNNQGQTPLHITQNSDVADLLIQSGAAINAADSNGNTPLHLVNDEAIFELLIASHADFRAVNGGGLSPYETVTNTTIRARLGELLGIAPEAPAPQPSEVVIPLPVEPVEQPVASSNTTVETRRPRRGLGSLRLPAIRSLLPGGKSFSLGNKNK